MAETGVRVALLARAGKARDQLHRALDEAGAVIVAEGDPAELDPGQVASHSPTVFLVSLEPAIEAALDRFDELLAAPGIEVMFDDAEVTGKLDGWDLNRWARHVASKLLGSEGLPPAPDGSIALPNAEFTLRPGAPPTPAELMDHAKLEDYTGETSALADFVPTSPSLMPSEPEGEFADPTADLTFTWDKPSEADGEFSLDNDLDIDLDLSELDAAHAPTDDLQSGNEFDTGPSEPVRFSSFGQDAVESTLGDLDADVAALAAHLEAFEKNDQRFADAEPAFQPAPVQKQSRASDEVAVADRIEVLEAPAAAVPEAAVSFDFSNLALAPIDGLPAMAVAEIVPQFATKPMAAAAAHDVAVEEAGIGAVLILAGLGGPDAVRQLLSSLPESLAVPVILYQHLEVGKHARLVEQLAKISRLPVALAEEGATAQAGKVTLLPAGMTALADGHALRFVLGTLDQLIAALPAADSMVVVLSGAELQLVPSILSVRDKGGIVLAQDPEVCFDATAAEAMQRKGAAVYPALGLAKQIATRWSA